MNQLAKILVTLGIIIVFIVLFTGVSVMRDYSGNSTPGILGLILFAALIGSLRAVWKKNRPKNNDNSDDMLQK